MWTEAGLDPASFYTYTLREVSEIVSAKAKREADLFKRGAQMQDVLMHRLAHKVMIGHHVPKDFPDYEPLDFGGDEAEERSEPTQADNLAIRSFFMFQTKRSQK